MMSVLKAESGFESVLSVIIGGLPETLVSASAHPLLYAVARRLPAVLRGGLEIRLAPEAARVDLHQELIHRRGDPHLLREHLNTIPAFARWWADESEPERASVASIWLEFDSIGEATTPCVFLSLDSDCEPSQVYPIVQEALDHLGGVSHTHPESLLSRCFEACSPPVWISHVGLMLSRPERGLRINVHGLNCQTLSAYLDAVRWPGDGDRVQDLIDWLDPISDWTVCALDVSKHVHPTIGFECFIYPSEGESTDVEVGKWGRMLEALEQRGLCDPVKGAALRHVHHLETPMTRGEDWPDDLILESLLDPATRFSAIQSGLHHIKVTLDATGSLSAKGYWWFGHRWVTHPGEGPAEG